VVVGDIAILDTAQHSNHLRRNPSHPAQNQQNVCASACVSRICRRSNQKARLTMTRFSPLQLYLAAVELASKHNQVVGDEGQFFITVTQLRGLLDVHGCTKENWVWP
jgi:hypothetical protein